MHLPREYAETFRRRAAVAAAPGAAMAYTDPSKAEQELHDHIKKALNDQETAPKAKHVRGTVNGDGRRQGGMPRCANDGYPQRGRQPPPGIILYSHAFKNTASYWMALKTVYPLLADEVVCFKALITIHKLLREGHDCVRPRSLQDLGITSPLLTTVDNCKRPEANAGHWRGAAADAVPGRGRHVHGEAQPRCGSLQTWKPWPMADSGLTHHRIVRRQTRHPPGYGELIKRYVAFLQTKITFHKEHPEFKGNMSYEDYLALRKASDVQEGYVQHC